MAKFQYTQRKKGIVVFQWGWLACIFVSILFIVLIMGYCDLRDDLLLDGTIIQNRQILSENQGFESREEELLRLAGELEKELIRSQERISRRLEELRETRGAVLGFVGKSDERARSGVAPEQRLKRRLMDARMSRGSGRDTGLGLSMGVGSSSSSISGKKWGVSYQHGPSIRDVKVKLTNNIHGIYENAPENRSAHTLTETMVIRPSYNNLISSDKSSENWGILQAINKVKKKTDISLTAYRANSRSQDRPYHPVHKSKKSIGDHEPNFQDLTKNHDSLDSNKISVLNARQQNVIGYNGTMEKNASLGSTDFRGPRPLVRSQNEVTMDKPLLGCDDLLRVNSREHVGSGYTKRVERVRLGDGRPAALKSVSLEGKDVTACVELGMAEQDCVRLANYKVLKEIALMQQLRHPNVLKLLGFCVSNDDQANEASQTAKPSSVVIAESGTPLSFLNFLQMAWEERLRVFYGISRLLDFFSESPLGSLSIHDFKISQFVLVDGEIKLADLDDVDDGLRSCSSMGDCGLEVGSNDTVFAQCRDGFCSNFSEISNLVHAHATFFSLFLFDAPRGMEDIVSKFLNNTKRATWSPRQTFDHMQEILDYYRDGKYILTADEYNTRDMPLQVLADRDLPGSDDYWCPGSRQQAPICVLSVYDDKEATRICARDRQCRAFVLTSQRTWTGRHIAYFKKGTSTSPQPSEGNTLYIFPR